MANELEILKKYRALKQELLTAKEAVDESEQRLRQIDAIRDEVYEDFRAGRTVV